MTRDNGRLSQEPSAVLSERRVDIPRSVPHFQEGNSLCVYI